MINILALYYDSFPPCHISKGKLKRDKIISKYNTKTLSFAVQYKRNNEK